MYYILFYILFILKMYTICKHIFFTITIIDKWGNTNYKPEGRIYPMMELLSSEEYLNKKVFEYFFFLTGFSIKVYSNNNNTLL